MEDMPDRVEILISSFKVVVLAIGSILATVVGWWMWEDPVAPRHGRLMVEIAAVVWMIMFGTISLLSVWILINRRGPGLVIDATGINQAPWRARGRHIPWADILGFKAQESGQARWIVVEVRDPDVYVRQAPKWTRAIGGIDKRYPVQITPRMLAIDFDDLLDLLKKYHERYQKTLSTNAA